MNPRRLDARDADAMARIHADSFAKPWPALDMALHVKRDLCIGVGVPLASFAILRTSDRDAEVLTVATGPEHRRRGLADRVLTAAHADCRAAGLREVFLEVAEDNTAAQALYRRLGYRPIGRRPGYYRRPAGRVAALTFSLPLDGD